MLTGEEATVVILPSVQERGEVVEPSQAGTEGDTVTLQHCQHSLHLLPGDLVLLLQSGHHLQLSLSQPLRPAEAEEGLVESGLSLSELEQPVRRERRVAGGRPASQLLTVRLVRVLSLTAVTERVAAALTQQTPLRGQTGQTHQAVPRLSQLSRGRHHCRPLSEHNFPLADRSAGHQSGPPHCEGMTGSPGSDVKLPVTLTTEHHHITLGAPEPPGLRTDKTW